MGLLEQYQSLLETIRSTAARANRDDNVLLLPVSKTQPISAIRALYDAGVRDFAENRVQELIKKKEVLPDDIRWHFIGHLQSNKAKYITPFITSIESIDSTGLAKAVSKKTGDTAIKILVEVNISGESQKQGIAPDEAEQLVLDIAEDCPNLEICGLMGMASFEENPENTRPQFLRLKALRDKLKERHPELKSFKELSMGMSNDFEVAIECGATIVRIGSALFGERE